MKNIEITYNIDVSESDVLEWLMMQPQLNIQERRELYHKKLTDADYCDYAKDVFVPYALIPQGYGFSAKVTNIEKVKIGERITIKIHRDSITSFVDGYRVFCLYPKYKTETEFVKELQRWLDIYTKDWEEKPTKKMILDAVKYIKSKME